MKSDNTSVWRRITVTALGAGAIAAGAMALGAPAAQASPTHIPADQFKQNCINWPFEPGSTQHSEYKENRVGSDLHQICNIWPTANQTGATLQTDSNVVVGYYKLKIATIPDPTRISSVAG